jgi:hypothetical protein
MPENKNITDYKVEVEHFAPKEFIRKVEEEQSIRHKFWLGFIGSVFSTLIAAVSLLITEFNYTRIRTFTTEFGWFMAIIFIFQLTIVGAILISRRRNRKVIELRKLLVRAYLTAMDKSILNPDPKGPMLVD